FIDVVSDTAFKDIDKTEIKLLIKNVDNTYKIKSLSECGDKLDQYQSIKYFIRVFIDRDLKGKVSSNIIKEINNAVMEEVTPS
ncbi:phosphohydrolase, partial [Klebsiella pneumoniae]